MTPPNTTFSKFSLGKNRNENKEDIKDITITCIDCGKDFIFTGGEQAYFKKMNLHQPKRCFSCRKKKREQIHGTES